MNTMNNTWTDEIDGTSTAWAQLPTAMKLSAPQGATNGNYVLVIANLSRVQHSEANVNTEFRIMVNGKKIGFANTGGAQHFNYRNIALHGLATVAPGDALEIEVQYKTQRGTVQWINHENGPQERVLTAIVL